MKTNIIHQGDCLATLRTLPDESIDCCVTSPPYYGLRDYGVDGQIGVEETPEAFISRLLDVFREVRRVLKSDGTLWVNMGDSYAGSDKGRNADGTVHLSAMLAKQGTNGGAVVGSVRSGDVPIGCKPKDLIGIPWMLAFALRADGWWLRQDIIWSKPNPMPESVKDRCTKSHEYIFMLSKSAKYYYDQKSVMEDAIYDGLKGQNPNGYKDARAFNGKHADKQRGHSRRHAGFNERWDQMTKTEQCSGKRNKRSVWNVATKPFSGAHFATFPTDLIEPCIRAGCREGGIVLDPFMGAGTTAIVAMNLGRKYIGCELNQKYVEIAEQRIKDEWGMFA